MTIIPVERLTTGTLIQPCLVHGCSSDARRAAFGISGYCNAHYKRLRRHGDPLGGRLPPEVRSEYFLNVVMKHDSDQCLIWPFTDDGYPWMTIDGLTTVVHREACRRRHGEAPSAAHESAHSCGNGQHGCVNPLHVRWATHAENMADKIGHGTTARGTLNPSAKLTEQAVRSIRSLVGHTSKEALARQFGVSRAAIRKIVNGQSWEWVE